MGYLHIPNLYKEVSMLQMFKELYAMEKIHGTSAHLTFDTKDINRVKFFAGGSNYEQFIKLFDAQALLAKFAPMGHNKVTVYGEAYGGKLQGMADTYGKDLKFIAFDVFIETDAGEFWLSVPKAEKLVQELGLEFVHYKLIPATIEAVNAERDADSVQAVRNGCGPGHMREGVVLRPLEELTRNNQHRIMAKHKRDEFRETATTRELDPEKLKTLNNANEIAKEWVVPQRLEHVLDKIPGYKIENTPDVIKAMLEDVKREAGNEIVWSKDVERAVGTEARKLFMAKVKKI